MAYQLWKRASSEEHATSELELLRAELEAVRVGHETSRLQLAQLEAQLKATAASAERARAQLERATAGEEAARTELERKDLELLEFKVMYEQSVVCARPEATPASPPPPRKSTFYAAPSIDGDLRSVRSEYSTPDGVAFAKKRGSLARTEKQWGDVMLRSSLFDPPTTRRQLAL
mmetsp:Transcript_1202/g.3927  ORF Transcript_1202/g.3927 Transcript_1202/m.3927 type:complete len:174 (-) Transcript_1202:173-694(-)